MKLTPFLLLVSVCAFAQEKDTPVKLSDYDSIDFDWEKELFRQWDNCFCPWLRPDSVRAMPRELHPYNWVNENKPIIIDDSTYQEWIKSDLAFKKMYQRADSLMCINDQKRKQKKQI